MFSARVDNGSRVNMLSGTADGLKKGNTARTVAGGKRSTKRNVPRVPSSRNGLRYRFPRLLDDGMLVLSLL